MLVKSLREGHPSTSSYQEQTYQVITSQNLSNQAQLILSREHQGDKGLNLPNNNVKHLNVDNRLNNKHQHHSSLEMSLKEKQRHLRLTYIGRGE